MPQALRVVRNAQDERELIPLPQAGRKLGISRMTLRRRIKAKQIRTVKIGPRSFVPVEEMDRLLSGRPETDQTEGLSLAPSNQISSDVTNGYKPPQDEPKTPKERLDAILVGYADFIEPCNAGDSEALARVAAVDTPEEKARKRRELSPCVTTNIYD
jgi:predicted DNA-binding transcriptional regulator AlpA